MGKYFRYSVGEYGTTVVVFKRAERGNVYMGVWDPAVGKAGGLRTWSLLYKDEERARRECHERHLELRRGLELRRTGAVTLARIFDEWRDHRMPHRSPREQKADDRRIELFSRYFGAATVPEKIGLREWESFIRDRSSGRIDSRGKGVRPQDAGDSQSGRPQATGGRALTALRVRPRTVQADLVWLNIVFNWAARWRSGDRYLLTENPIRGFEIPVEKNPRRPVASLDRYEAVLARVERRLAAYDRLLPRLKRMRRARARRIAWLYLRDFLPILAGTGRRLSACCQLTFGDVRWDQGPHGAIAWPAETDKGGRSSVVVIGPDVRVALERIRADRPGVHGAPLFPSPRNPELSISRHLVDKWMRRAEQLARVKPLDGSLAHAYKRAFVTSRKGHPLPDIGRAVGNRDLRNLERSYMHADDETIERVVLQPTMELRERRQG